MGRVLATLVVGLLVVVLSLADVSGAARQKVTIIMTEFAFSPATITLRAGAPAEIILVNKGKVEHEFMVYLAPKAKVTDWDEYIMENTYFKDIGEVEGEFSGIGAVAGTRVFEVEVKPGKRAEVKFTPSRAGTFEIGCHVAGHYEAGMKGTLIVK